MACKKGGTFVVVVLRKGRRLPKEDDCSFVCEKHLREMVERAIPQSVCHRVSVSYSPVGDAPCELES